MNKKQISVIKQLQVLLGGAEQFVLTGSSVVALQGLTTEIKDIDIVLVNPLPSCLEILDNQVKTFPVYKEETNKRLKEKGMYIFTFQDIKVDVFTEDTIYDKNLTYDGIILSPINRLVDAKKKFRRIKDLMQRRAWAGVIFKHEELDMELTKIVESENYDKNGATNPL